MAKRRVALIMTALVLLSAAFVPAVSAYTYNTVTASENPSGYYKTIWGYDEPEFAVGMKLGDKTDDKGKYITDASIGSHGYDMVVKNDGKGQNGKYAEIKVNDVPNDFKYVNPIFDLTRYPGKEKVNDFNGFEEMWIWVDIRGFGDQMTKDPVSGKDVPGFDFSFQIYEQDWKDGKKVAGKFERWAIAEGGEFYLQEGNGWKKHTAKAAMMTTLPQNYKGWVRVPFSSMEIVAILGIGNMKLDLNYVVNFTLGIPMDESTVGKTMIIDSIVLYSSKSMPASSSPKSESSKSDAKQASSKAADSSSLAGDSSAEEEESQPEESGASSAVAGSESEAPAGGGQGRGESGGAWAIYVILAAAAVLVAGTAIILIRKSNRSTNK